MFNSNQIDIKSIAREALTKATADIKGAVDVTTNYIPNHCVHSKIDTIRVLKKTANMNSLKQFIKTSLNKLDLATGEITEDGDVCKVTFAGHLADCTLSFKNDKTTIACLVSVQYTYHDEYQSEDTRNDLIRKSNVVAEDFANSLRIIEKMRAFV